MHVLKHASLGSAVPAESRAHGGCEECERQKDKADLWRDFLRCECCGVQGNTILAMDYMDNGNLWDVLPRVAKDGRLIFQWNNRGKRVAYEIALGLHFLHDLR